MIQLYVVSGCRSSQKAREWLKKNNLDFKEVNLQRESQKVREDLISIISLLDGGVFDLINSKLLNSNDLKESFKNFTLLELVDYLISKPRLLKHPIIYDGCKVQIGFNVDEIRVFIPKDIRRMKAMMITEKITLN